MRITAIHRMTIATIAVMVILCMGCKKEKLASAEWEWKDQQWIHGDKKTLTMTATDTTTLYKMDLKVSHKDTYPYNNLYVRTVTTYPSGKEVVSVTSLELVDPDGQWAGKKRATCCELKLPLQSRFTFPEVGEYTWTIEPYMRVDTVTGI